MNRKSSQPDLGLCEATNAVDDIWAKLPPHLRPGLLSHVDALTQGEAPKAENTESTLYQTVFGRVRMLAVLMIFQSFSGFILDGYSAFIQRNMFVTLYLTMLVGAGGNAGNQSAVSVIRSLATGAVARGDLHRVLCRETLHALFEGALLTMVGFWRVYLWQGELRSTVAVCVALFAITSISVVVGCVLPFAFDHLGMDPAHAGPAIQVVMDVMGVSITCAVCSFLMMGDPAALAAVSASDGAGGGTMATEQPQHLRGQHGVLRQ